jgi:hypothetical protein
MTLALSIRVNDGFVLAADSAMTFRRLTGDGRVEVTNVFNTAEKLFDLRPGLPLGLLMWGVGNIGNVSVASLLKDLRQRFSGQARGFEDWAIDPDDYTIRGVADRVREFLFQERYQAAHRRIPREHRPYLGVLLAGYGPAHPSGEQYKVQVEAGRINGPEPVIAGHGVGTSWFGEPEAITRLMLGYGTELPAVLRDELGIPQEEIGTAMAKIRGALQMPFITDAMPLGDAIDVAAFLAEAAITYQRFAPGWPTVGGPVEIATVTRHDGFRWVRRKQYYPAELNREGQSWNTGTSSTSQARPTALRRDGETAFPDSTSEPRTVT